MGNDSSTLVRQEECEAWTGVSRATISNSNSVHKGFRNLLGENNCFINVVIQALWHLNSFRNLITTISHKHTDSLQDACICCALKNLFVQYQYSPEVILPPDELRGSLSSLFQNQRFQLGSMDDATEVLEIILKYLHFDHVRCLGLIPGTFSTNGAVQDSLDTSCSPSCISHSTFGYDSFDQQVYRLHFFHSCWPTDGNMLRALAGVLPVLRYVGAGAFPGLHLQGIRLGAHARAKCPSSSRERCVLPRY